LFCNIIVLKKLTRKLDIIRVLIAWAPLTTESIFQISQSFRFPFTTMRRCREELQNIYHEGLVGRSRVPGITMGNTPFAYHLRRKASVLVPSVADIPKSNSVFQKLGMNPWHSLAIGEFGTLLEKHAAIHPDIEILETIRDRQFRADLRKHGFPQLIPDGTVLLRIRGKLRVFFLEIVNELSVLNPGVFDARSRSLAAKVSKYRFFKELHQQHPVWRLLEEVYGPIHGFQVLFVSTRTSSQRLTIAATGSREMFLFGDASVLQTSTDLFTEPVWWFPRSNWRKNGPLQGSLLNK
jgi:hypothetical protein